MDKTSVELQTRRDPQSTFSLVEANKETHNNNQELIPKNENNLIEKPIGESSKESHSASASSMMMQLSSLPMDEPTPPLTIQTQQTERPPCIKREVVSSSEDTSSLISTDGSNNITQDKKNLSNNNVSVCSTSTSHATSTSNLPQHDLGSLPQHPASNALRNGISSTAPSGNNSQQTNQSVGARPCQEISQKEVSQVRHQQSSTTKPPNLPQDANLGASNPGPPSTYKGERNPLLENQRPTVHPGQKISQKEMNDSTEPKQVGEIHKTAPPSSIPDKATKFIHLSHKYSIELEYMLVEFRKLERQLLSGQAAKRGVEGQASRERREKLHSFIQHLDSTSKQIKAGCQADAEKNKKMKEAGGSKEEIESRKTEEEKEKENVQRLEEHILTNLLPVKNRLVKQLAAQGKSVGNASCEKKTHIPRGYPQPQNRGPVAFAAPKPNLHTSAVYPARPMTYEPRVDEADGSYQNDRNIDSQYGQPIGKGKGSSLTKKLHGSALGSPSLGQIQSTDSETLGLDGQPVVKRKILYGGMAPGSDMNAKMSSVDAAAVSDEMTMDISSPIGSILPDPIASSREAERQVPTPLLEDKNKVQVLSNEPSQKTQYTTVQTPYQQAIKPNSKIGKVPQPITVNSSNIQPSQVKPAPPVTTTILNKKIEKRVPKPTHTVASVRQPLTHNRTPMMVKRPASAAADAAVSRSKKMPPRLNNKNVVPPHTRLVSTPIQTKVINPDNRHKVERTQHALPAEQAKLMERRQKRLDRRRRRRKRRKARLRAITEAYRVNSSIHQSNFSGINGNHAGSSNYSTQPAMNGGDLRNGDVYHHLKVNSGVNSQGHFSSTRTVEYICAHCSEQYTSTCEFNPWWALTQEECPKCRKTQIPRIDITAPQNIIEYHPALLAHADDNGNGGGDGSTMMGGMALGPMHKHNPRCIPISGNMVTSTHHNFIHITNLPNDSDGSEDEKGLDDDASSGESTVGDPLEEDFGKDYTGPKFTDVQARKLLILMEHASTCPGRHKSYAHSHVCHSVKMMMLHVRDCPGITTTTGDVCPFPWCRKVKHLLYHLVTCQLKETCPICTQSSGLSVREIMLTKMNKYRRQKEMDKLKQKKILVRHHPMNPNVKVNPTNTEPRPVFSSTVVRQQGPPQRQNTVVKGQMPMKGLSLRPLPKGATYTTQPQVIQRNGIKQVLIQNQNTKPQNKKIIKTPQNQQRTTTNVIVKNPMKLPTKQNMSMTSKIGTNLVLSKRVPQSTVVKSPLNPQIYKPQQRVVPAASNGMVTKQGVQSMVNTNNIKRKLPPTPNPLPQKISVTQVSASASHPPPSVKKRKIDIHQINAESTKENGEKLISLANMLDKEKLNRDSNISSKVCETPVVKKEPEPQLHPNQPTTPSSITTKIKVEPTSS